MHDIPDLNHLWNLWSACETVDLSPTIETGMPRWPTHPVVVVNPSIVHERDGYFCQTVFFGEHTGSHVDAPAHIHPDRMHLTIDTYEVDRLIGPAKVLDFSEDEIAPGHLLGADDLRRALDARNLRLESGDMALLNFGWMQRHWRSDKQWNWYGSNSPGLAVSACEFLAEAGIRAVGCDTIACDLAVIDGEPQDQPGHETFFLPNDILIVECLANLERLTGECLFVAMPLKIHGGSGSPIRAMALQPHSPYSRR